MAVWGYWSFVVPMAQVGNSADIRYWQGALSEFRDRTGHYPGSLTEGMYPETRIKDRWLFEDKWGNPLHYYTEGDAFVVASFGRDGRCDIASIKGYLSYANERTERNCYDRNADTVLTEKGLQKGCGK